MARILVVDDDVELCSLIEDYLVSQNHSVDVAHDGEEATVSLKINAYDVIILDWELPKLTGIDVCKRYRSLKGESPVIMLTGKKLLDDKISGLDAGADDYVTKPFEIAELSARIRALLRRPAAVKSNVLTARELVFDTDKMSVHLAGEELYFVPKELALLEFFMRNPNHVFSSEVLINRVWPSDSEASPDTVRTYINKLRKKLDKPDSESFIRTVHGLGYKFEP